MEEAPPNQGTPATRKLWTAASVAVCVVALSGCKGCDENILDVGGAKLAGPTEVDPGAPVQFRVAGGIGTGPEGKCPKTIQMSYVELDDKGDTLNIPSASRGKITEIKLKKSATKKSRTAGCKLKKPRVLPINISPGRRDQHKVKVTVTLHGAPNVPPAKPGEGAAERMATVFKALAVAEARRIVTVKGVVPPPNTPPVAAFIASQSPAKTGEPLGLDARLSSDDGSIGKYEWDLNGDGVYEKSSASPTSVRVDSALATRQPVRLRVTDNRGARGETQPVSIQSTGHVYTDGTPTLSPEVTGPGKPVTVGVRSTSPSEAYSADLTCDTTLTSGPLATPATGETFPQPCTFATAGFKAIAVTYKASPGNTLPATTFYRLAQIVPGARSGARAAATAPRLAVPLRLSGATLKRLGRIRLRSTTGTVRGLIATGSGRGTVPKQTPRRFRSALSTLASGRFAVSFNGSGKLESTTINLSGSATMLVRSRRSRKTQVCLSVKAAGGGGPARFSVRGATGRARGFAATGTGPPISFADGTGRTSRVTLAPRKGKARRLSRACRSLSRVLDGKKLKSKQRKSKRRRR